LFFIPNILSSAEGFTFFGALSCFLGGIFGDFFDAPVSSVAVSPRGYADAMVESFVRESSIKWM
jgi:hypothetical protein